MVKMATMEPKVHRVFKDRQVHRDRKVLKVHQEQMVFLPLLMSLLFRLREANILLMAFSKEL
jgi:hypothetical protein